MDFVGNCCSGEEKSLLSARVLVEIVCNASYRKLSVGGKTTNWCCGNREAVESYIVIGSGNGRKIVGRLALGELEDAAMEQRDILVDWGRKIEVGIAEVLLESRGPL